MLRQAQHERHIRNDFSTKSVRPEPVEGRRRVFSPHLKKDSYSRGNLGRGELQTAHELAEQMLTLAQSVQDPALRLEAHWTLGITLFWLGELASAREHLEQGTALYDPQQHSSHAFLYGEDPGVFCLSFAAWTLWLLGYPDQALQRSHEALTLAQEVSHPLSLTYALHLAARLQLCQRLEQMVDDARASGIVTRILVGGSMVRATAEPNDFDCIIVLRAETQYGTLRPDQLKVADARLARDRYVGDIFIAREGQSTLSLYIDFFSRNRDGKIVGMIEVTP